MLKMSDPTHPPLSQIQLCKNIADSCLSKGIDVLLLVVS